MLLMSQMARIHKFSLNAAYTRCSWNPDPLLGVQFIKFGSASMHLAELRPESAPTHSSLMSSAELTWNAPEATTWLFVVLIDWNFDPENVASNGPSVARQLPWILLLVIVASGALLYLEVGLLWHPATKSAVDRAKIRWVFLFMVPPHFFWVEW